MARPPQFSGYSQPQLPPVDANRGVSWYDLRTAVGGIEQRLAEQLEGIRQRLVAGEARIQDVIRGPDPRMAAMGALGCGCGGSNDATGMLGKAVLDGRVLPYMLSIDIPYDKAIEGERIVGQVIATADGPVFITNLYGFAQIDSKDVDAQNFPFSLIQPPSCNPDCGDNAFDSADANATFTIDFGSQLIPGVDARGMFIPLSPAQCRLISPTAVNLCTTLACPNATDKNFQAVVPLVLLDHPECLDGITEIKVNSCSWQNTQFPLALWDPAIGWDLTNEAPNCIQVGGYLNRDSMLQVALTLTRPSKFNVIVTFVFAGFRLVTCQNWPPPGGPATTTTTTTTTSTPR